MNINEKIEEIRKKPEHEKVRYVWGMVAISMFCIIVLWVVSLKDTFSNTSSSINNSVAPEQINLGGITNSVE